MSSKQIIKGSLTTIILKLLEDNGRMYGYEMTKAVKENSKGKMEITEAALYPALHKLEQQGWIKSEWKVRENNRRAKFYSLTRLGRKRLGAEKAAWERLSTAITTVVRLEEA